MQNVSALTEDPDPKHLSDFGPLNFNLQYDGTVKIEVINMLGETIYLIQPGNLTAGNYDKKITLNSLTPGSYFIKFTAGNRTEILDIKISH